MKIKTTPMKASWKKVCCRCERPYLTTHRHQHVCDECKQITINNRLAKQVLPIDTTTQDKTLEILQKTYPANIIAAYVALGEIYPNSWKEIVYRANKTIADTLIAQAEKQLNSEFHKAVMNKEK